MTMIQQSHGRDGQHTAGQSLRSGSLEYSALSPSALPLHLPETSTSGVNQNSNVYSYHQQQSASSWQEQPQEPSSSGRSRAIAIVKAGDVVEQPEETDDDDDSVIDVELDAIKLRKKYGSSIVKTFQDESILAAKTKGMLEAPFLGSLNLSEGYMLSLPPMTLSDFHTGEPPRDIGSYGSLRDSQQRGTFLDGPSSYREPMSGQIRKLDHRVRYHGLPPQAMSIGERLQQSRKLKETKKKEHESAKDDDGKSTKGSLSAMMNEVEKAPNSLDKISPQQLESTLGHGESSGLTYEVPTFGQSHHIGVNDPPTMMSTSLTAFEVLKSTNRAFVDESIIASSYHRSQTGLGNGDNNESDDRRFQPLSRSMSDPTPKNPSLSALMNNLSLLQPQQTIPSPGHWAPYTSDVVGDSTGVNAMNPNHHHELGFIPNQTVNQYSLQDHNPEVEGAFDMDME